MKSNIRTDATCTWETLLSDILYGGSRSGPRNMITKELIGNTTEIEMEECIVNDLSRKVSYNFMLTEAWWILSGRNDVETLAKYAPSIGQFSDDGKTFSGAYGPKVTDQFEYVVDQLCRDSQTRQAVMAIWIPNPEPSKDIPCTIALQFLIRENKLHCIASMRSSDAWIGYIYDIFVFTCISIYVMAEVKSRLGLSAFSITLGKLTLTAGSQHLYEKNWKDATKIIRSPTCRDYINPASILPISSVAAGCKTGKDLIEILQEVKDRHYETN